MGKFDLFKYILEPNNGESSPINAEAVHLIYSSFWQESVFLIIKPETNIDHFLHKDILIRIIVNGGEISQWVYIKHIEKYNDCYIFQYYNKEISKFDIGIFSFAQDLYFNFNKSQKVWQNLNSVDKTKYLFTLFNTVSWKRSSYPKSIIVDGNNINGCLDFYCELGFLLNNNQWGYFGWNLNALDDCLRSLPKDTKIVWKNYKRSRIFIDQDYEKSTRLGFSYTFYPKAEQIFNLLKEYVDVERID